MVWTSAAVTQDQLLLLDLDEDVIPQNGHCCAMAVRPRVVLCIANAATLTATEASQCVLVTLTERAPNVQQQAIQL